MKRGRCELGLVWVGIRGLGKELGRDVSEDLAIYQLVMDEGVSRSFGIKDLAGDFPQVFEK
jgi:hypothetical protein